jgi:hypothetical protein
MKGFDPKWCKWIYEFISSGSVGIRESIMTLGTTSKREKGYDKGIFFLPFFLIL